MLPPVSTTTAAGGGGEGSIEFKSAFTEAFGGAHAPEGNEDLAFSTTDNPFAGLKGMYR